MSLCLVLILTFHILSASAQISCLPGSFGDDCRLTCHCVNQCSSVGCEDYQCKNGYLGAPECQQTCSSNNFGVNCKGDCHCRSGSPCEPTNGFCVCHEEWYGPSCQIRRPKLTQAPSILNRREGSVDVGWKAWNNRSDVGTAALSVTKYEVQVSKHATEEPSTRVWTSHTNTTQLQSEYTADTNGDSSFYSFRVLCYWEDTGKLQAGLHSPISESIRLPLLATTTISFTTLADTTTSQLTTLATTMLLDIVTTLPPTTTEMTTATTQQTTSPPPITTEPIKKISAQTQLTPLDGKPEAPIHLQKLDRNETCLRIQWKPPRNKNGILTQYRISLTPAGSKEETFTLKDQVDTLITPQIVICDLKASSFYSISVFASTSSQEGDPVSKGFFTEVGQPPPPPEAIITEVSSTTATLQLRPASISTGPVSRYYIVVQESNKPNRLITFSYNGSEELELHKDPIQSLNLRGYTAAELLKSNITTVTNFVAGNNKEYGRFRNKPLINQRQYRFLYVLSSSMDGVTKMSYSQTEVVKTGDSITQPSTTKTTSQNTIEIKTSTKALSFTKETLTQNPVDWRFVALGIVLGLLLILILILCLANICYKRSTLPNTFVSKSKLAKEIFSYKNLQSPEEPIRWTCASTVDEKRFPIYNNKDERLKKVNKPSISFEDEFNQLPAVNSYFCSEAKLFENKETNRFDHILPFDSSRVHLRTNKNEKTSDYINASYIFNNSKQKTYVAAQSPFNQQTICDFWSMVYEQMASAIIMLSNTIEEDIVKCEQYWPSDSYARKYGKITVKMIKITTNASYIIREFVIKNETKDSRETSLKQYHFTAWDSVEKQLLLLEFWQMVSMDQRIQNGKRSSFWIIHCSTGVSRTGVFIALDHCLNKFTSQQGINVYRTCSNMRKYRPFMVRTYQNYKLIYDLLYEAMAVRFKEMFLNIGNTYLVFNDLRTLNPATSTSLLKEQYYLCERISRQPEEKHCAVALSDKNKNKNRFNTANMVAKDSYRVRLYDTECPSDDLYINATFVESHLQRRHLISTQDPLQATCVDFWKMIYETDCKCIVDMNPLERPCDKYLPRDKNQELIVGDKYCIKMVQQHTTESYVKKTLVMTCLMHPCEKERRVWHYDFRDWINSKETPSCRLGLIKMFSDLQHTTLLARPIVVHCLNANSHSGLFCACLCIWMKVKAQESVDIFHLVRKLKNRSFQFINSHVQYSYLFKFLWESLNLSDK